jgi:hypothetical protein
MSGVPTEVLMDTISSKYTQPYNKRAAQAELARRGENTDADKKVLKG